MTILHSLRLGAGIAVLFAAACGQPTAPATETAAAPAEATAPAAESTCPDDGPRLALTQLCAGRVINYLDPNVGLIQETPDGCEWLFTETPFAEDVLVYRALKCKDVATALDYRGGAQSAALGYKTSALYADAAPATEPVRIFVSDPADPQKIIRDQLQAAPAAERAKCEIQPANNDFWPKDALVLTYTKAERAKQPTDEPISMCGPFGNDEDSAAYWRIAFGHAWFFSMGQDSADFDPGSFMLFRKGADGSWAPAT